MQDVSILRILDASANRAREALRVLEDVTRFALNDVRLSAELKALRHDLAAALASLPMEHAMVARDTVGDVGTAIKTEAELVRPTLSAVATAAAKRLSEALRSIEECAKTIDSAAAMRVEQLRYRGYTLEQAVARVQTFSPAAERFAKVRLYVLLTERFCHPAVGGWEKALAAVLAASPGDGSLAVQLREKELEGGELLQRTEVFVRKCRAAGAVAILNDRPDVAVMAGADGVHVGQMDLPVEAVRRLVGAEMIVGVSTENLAQARAAAGGGATYIGVGPMFPTKTKEKPRLAGPGYAAAALAEVALPAVAIGGITLENVGALTAVGVRAVAVCGAVIGEADPGAAAGLFLEKLTAKTGAEGHR
jgi:thiamine-phosphate pyrophosphorylase